MKKSTDFKDEKVRLEDILPTLEIKKEEFGYSIFVDGQRIRTCTNIDFSISAMESQGKFAKVNLGFMAKIDVDANVIDMEENLIDLHIKESGESHCVTINDEDISNKCKEVYLTLRAGESNPTVDLELVQL